jgi:hypothetical protein
VSSLSFGGDTVTVVNFTQSATKDPWGEALPIESPTTVRNCQFEQMSTQEVVALTDQSGEFWHLIAPPIAALLAAKADSQIRQDGVTYEIWGGIGKIKDASGSVFYVEAVCKRQQKDIS